MFCKRKVLHCKLASFLLALGAGVLGGGITVIGGITTVIRLHTVAGNFVPLR